MFSSSARILNATFTVLISFCIAFNQRSFTFSLSTAKASSTVLCTLIPNLCVFLWYLLLTAARILSHFFKTWVVHPENACSSLIPIASAYSATSTGYDSFMSLNLSHEVDISFLSMQSYHPLVVLCFVCLAMQCNIMVIFGSRHVVLAVIHNVIHKPVSIPFNITLSIHASCNDICTQLCILTI